MVVATTERDPARKERPSTLRLRRGGKRNIANHAGVNDGLVRFVVTETSELAIPSRDLQAGRGVVNPGIIPEDKAGTVGEAGEFVLANSLGFGEAGDLGPRVDGGLGGGGGRLRVGLVLRVDGGEGVTSGMRGEGGRGVRSLAVGMVAGHRAENGRVDRSMTTGLVNMATCSGLRRALGRDWDVLVSSGAKGETSSERDGDRIDGRCGPVVADLRGHVEVGVLSGRARGGRGGLVLSSYRKHDGRFGDGSRSGNRVPLGHLVWTVGCARVDGSMTHGATTHVGEGHTRMVAMRTIVSGGAGAGEGDRLGNDLTGTMGFRLADILIVGARTQAHAVEEVFLDTRIGLAHNARIGTVVGALKIERTGTVQNILVPTNIAIATRESASLVLGTSGENAVDPGLETIGTDQEVMVFVMASLGIVVCNRLVGTGILVLLAFRFNAVVVFDRLIGSSVLIALALTLEAVVCDSGMGEFGGTAGTVSLDNTREGGKSRNGDKELQDEASNGG